jgi:hypothetical protein
MKRPALFVLTAAVLTATLLAAQAAAPEVEITAEPHHHLIFENKYVRAFNVEVPPRTDSLMHWHRHDYFAVNLGAAEVINAVKDKPPVTVKLQDGQTTFASAAFAHIARNQTGQPFRNVTIEILDDANLRHSTTKWDEDRALETFPGGTQQILFVKDAIRVSEFELQPGAVIPAHPPSHSLLLVAVTDLDLFPLDSRTRGPDDPSPKSTTLNSGSSVWFPQGLAHPITNKAANPAKFVILEFP